MTSATEAFDPYAAWLGIAPHERPVNHYLLLGLPRFEADRARIAAAADERMRKVREFQHGPRAALSQRMLNELAAARVCLLDPSAKESYDSWLTAMTPSAPSHSAPVARVLGISPAGPPLPPPVSEVSPVAPPLPDESGLDEAGRPSPARPWGLIGLIALGLLLIVMPMVWWYRRPSVGTAVQPQSAPVVPDGEEAGAESDPFESPDPMPAASPELQRAVLLEQEADGTVNFTPATAVLQGNVELAVAGTEYVLINWTAPEDTIRWRFRLLDPAIFSVEVSYLVEEASEGGRISLEVDGERKTLTTRRGNPPDAPVTDTLFLKIGRSGEHILTLQGLEKAGKEYCILQGIRIVPPKEEPQP
jgi:hypothetical protein